MQRSIGLISFFFKNSDLLSIDVLCLLYSNAILPHFTYGTEIWGAFASSHSGPALPLPKTNAETTEQY